MDYHANFDLSEKDQIKEYFDTFGYVVIRNVLSADECKSLYGDIGDQMTKLNPKFNIFDVETYDDAPVGGNYGMYANSPIFTKQFLLTRQNRNVYNAFRILYENKDLIVSHDRCCFYRPTQIIKDGLPVEKGAWKTAYKFPNLHLDFHPLGYEDPEFITDKREGLTYDTVKDFIAENNYYCKYDGLQIQAIINVLNNSDEDGGFQCVPNFPTMYDEWFSGAEFREKDTTSGKYLFEQHDMKYLVDKQRISVPRGAMILWNNKMAHGSCPNNSQRPRCCIFLKMYPKEIMSKERYDKRRTALSKILAKSDFTEISDIGKTVFGLNPY